MSNKNFLDSHIGKNVNMKKIRTIEKLYQKKAFPKEIQRKRKEFLQLEQALEEQTY